MMSYVSNSSKLAILCLSSIKLLLKNHDTALNVDIIVYTFSVSDLFVNNVEFINNKL